MTKVYGYYRVSTELQAQQGYSLASQVQEIESYCKEQGWQLVQLFSDNGISGAINDDEDLDLSKRPGINAMLGSLKGIDKIVVIHTSRLWRNVMAQALIQREIRKQGSDIASIQQPTFSVFDEVKDPTAFLINTMLGALDTFDKMNTVNKMTAGKDRKVQEGERGSGNTPIGYMWTVADKKKVVVVDSDAMALVKIIFSKYLELQSVNAVAKWMTSKGHLTQRGKVFTAPSIKVILGNRFYIGELIWNGINYPANHEPIVSKVVFGKVTAMLERNKHNKKMILV